MTETIAFLDRNFRDRLEIRELIEQCWAAADYRDDILHASCFTIDGVWETTIPGVGPFAGRPAILAEALRGLDDLGPSVHAVAHLTIRIDGDTATSTMLGFSHLVVGENHVQRSIRCDDLLVRIDGQWLLKHRKHHPMWQAETRTVPLGVSRVRLLPDL